MDYKTFSGMSEAQQREWKYRFSKDVELYSTQMANVALFLTMSSALLLFVSYLVITNPEMSHLKSQALSILSTNFRLISACVIYILVILIIDIIRLTIDFICKRNWKKLNGIKSELSFIQRIKYDFSK